MIVVSIIEDIKEIREGLQLLIDGSNGYSSRHTFSSAEEAIKQIPFTDSDVVLVDINLPGINGIECVRILKVKCPHIQFIMSTVYDDDDNIFESLKAGATGYLLKKTEPVKILEAISDVYKGGSPMSTQIARKVISSFQHHKSIEETEILTTREKLILKELSKGLRYKEIASDLNISTETVRSHARNIYEKLHVQSRTEALNKVFGKD